MKKTALVEWTVDARGHHTTRSGPWRFTVFPCSTGWAWVQEPHHNVLAPALTNGVTPSLLSAQKCVAEIIGGSRGT